METADFAPRVQKSSPSITQNTTEATPNTDANNDIDNPVTDKALKQKESPVNKHVSAQTKVTRGRRTRRSQESTKDDIGSAEKVKEKAPPAKPATRGRRTRRSQNAVSDEATANTESTSKEISSDKVTESVTETPQSINTEPTNTEPNNQDMAKLIDFANPPALDDNDSRLSTFSIEYDNDDDVASPVYD